jgi:voltage-gated potassium channel Kch
MKGAKIGARLRYAFDNSMARGPSSLILWLAAASLALILVIAGIVSISGISPDAKGFTDVLWMSLMRTLDPGTMGGDQGSWWFLFAMLAVTIGGIFIISTLIGVLTASIDAKLGSLRKGRSRVIEEGQTVILGWSSQVFSIIPELVEASANQRRSCVVLLADKDKVEMEDEIRSRCGSLRRTKVVCRSGDPMDMNDLEIVSLDTAKSILVLSQKADDPDSDVIKTILAITNNPRRKKEPYHIVAELRDPKNVEVAKMVGKDEVEIVLVSDLVARIISQTCRQTGLSVVYTELLDFGGDEIYFHEPEPELVGRPLMDALTVYKDSSVIGLVPSGRAPSLNPPLDTPISEGDKLIVIAEDDDTTKMSDVKDREIDLGAINDKGSEGKTPERILVLGWNWRAPMIINELEHYVAPGSEVTVVAHLDECQREIGEKCPGCSNLKISFRKECTTSRKALDSLNVPSYNHIILLCYSDSMDTQEADAQTLITLLHLREISGECEKRFSIVSEMLDVRNRNLAEVTQADDFIVSDRLVSLLMAQIAENKQLNAVFADVFDPEGSEIYLKPAFDYVKPGASVNFYTVIESAKRRGHIVIGYKLKRHATDSGKSYGVVVNPSKSERVCFEEGDKIVVIAED